MECVGCLMVAINTSGCLFGCTVNRRGVPVGAAEPQTHFTPPLPIHTNADMRTHGGALILHARTCSTRRPSSPCSEIHEFAAVLNHFNHLNGECLIHSYLSVLPRSSVMSTLSLSPPQPSPPPLPAYRQIHTQTQRRSGGAVCTL